MVSYSAEDFVGALTSDEGLPQPQPTLPVIQTGMVDAEGSGSEEIRFAPGMQCTNWTNIPVSLIDTVDHLSNQRCGQYEYPYVRIRLKGSTELTDEARAIADILQQPGTTPRPTTPPTRPVPTTPVPATPPVGRHAAPPASRHAAPVGRHAAPPVGRHAAPASRRLPPDARPGFNTPGPVKGCS
jgi:hypothetical protein